MATDTNADMSYQNTIFYKGEEFFDSLRRNGVKITMKKVFRRLHYLLIGVDFSTQNLHNLTIVGDNRDRGTALVSTSKDFLEELFEILQKNSPAKFKREGFVDLGSGKGAAIIYARMLGFKRSLGVEFAKELHEKAEINIKKLDVDRVVSINEDAAGFIPPKDSTVIFLFNPFDEIVMKKVAENILNARENFLYPAFLIYVNPTAFEILDDCFDLLLEKEFSSGAKVRFYMI